MTRSHPQPGIDLTSVKRTGEANGDAGDPDTGTDRFGRLVDQRWVAAATGVAAGAKTAGVCASLQEIDAGLDTLVSFAGVEPTNSAAARASGSRFVERVLTVVASRCRQGRDALALLTEAVQAARTGATSPSLHPAFPPPRQGVNADSRSTRA